MRCPKKNVLKIDPTDDVKEITTYLEPERQSAHKMNIAAFKWKLSGFWLFVFNRDCCGKAEQANKKRC